ncbi:MAG: ATP synthase F1 subunit delta [Candidatus Doudnabacteria bacterium]|nr:ATP synthase F1 subunit delta [Candidatus Doudnabacteria bacterium]
MKFSAKQYAQTLHDSLSESKPPDTDKILDNFVTVLVENNQIRLFDEIADEFMKIDLDRKGIKLAEVSSAKPLSLANEQKIIEQLNHLVSSKVQLKKQIDENLLGGVVIRLDDKLIDISVKNELKQLRSELIK